MELHYRQGATADIKHLLALGILAYGQFQQVLTEENWNKMYANLSSEKTYADLIEKSNCFVCLANGEIVGMAYLMPSGNPTKIFQADWSYIRMVGVDPRFEARGIAKKLTQLCMECAIQKKEKIIALHTSEFMDAARHIYESAGFKKAKEIEPLFGKRYWLYKLEL